MKLRLLDLFLKRQEDSTGIDITLDKTPMKVLLEPKEAAETGDLNRI